MLTGDLTTAVERAKQAADGTLICFGGAGFARALIERGLVDELHLYTNPGIAGRGERIFTDNVSESRFTLLETIGTDCGIVITRWSTPSEDSRKPTLPGRVRRFGPRPYLLFNGSARRALSRYHEVFGGELLLHSYAEFGRTDGPADAIAHGVLAGPASLYASDAAPDEATFDGTGLFLSLLGTAEPAVLHGWFDALAVGGEVIDPLQKRQWNAWDGQVRDAFGVTWLIGYEIDSL